MVHARKTPERTLTFGHTGWLSSNAFLLYDKETGSIWHHATGVAMSGPLRGTQLARYDDTAVMTFAAWRAEHPDTLVLAKPAGAKEPMDRDVYDARNAHVEFGLSLEIPAEGRFYPFAKMASLDALEDDAAGTPVVVVRDRDAAVARAFDRRVGADTLSFDLVAGARPELRERGGRRSWYLRSGEPVPGSGAEAPLCPLPATAFERTAWRSHHPAGSIVERR